MATGRHGKVPFSAMVLQDLAVAMQRWLKRNSGLSRTDFVARALAEKLWRSGVDVRFSSPRGRSQKLRVEMSEPTGEVLDASGEFKEVMIKGWLDEALVSEVDKLIRKVRPRLNRSILFSEAAAEMLEAEGVITRKQALRHGAHQDIVRATQDMERLLEKQNTSNTRFTPELKDWPKSKQIAYVRKMLTEFQEALAVLDRTRLRVTEIEREPKNPSRSRRMKEK